MPIRWDTEMWQFTELIVTNDWLTDHVISVSQSSFVDNVSRLSLPHNGDVWFTQSQTVTHPVLVKRIAHRGANCRTVNDCDEQNASSYSIGQLREASNYVVRVAATSAAGMGRHANARFTTPRLQPLHAVTDRMYNLPSTLAIAWSKSGDVMHRWWNLA